MSKLRLLLALILALSFALPTAATAAAVDVSYIQLEHVEDGIVETNYASSTKLPVKIQIGKGKEKYTYDASAYNRFPLQMGDGTYTVMILEQASGTKYRLIEQQVVEYKAKSDTAVYLQSVQNIRWDAKMKAIKKAEELTGKAKTDEEKIGAVYRFIVGSVKYDNPKAAKVASGYVPSIEQTYADLKGICYDYAALNAAMLRSLGIPAKLVMGKKKDVKEYHAWNEVYLEDADKWVTIDTTYDAALGKNANNKKIYKDAAEYTADKHY